MKNYFKLFFIGASLLIASCSSDSTDDLTEPVEGPVTYADNVQSIFNNNCISCHSGGAPVAGLSLANYTEVRAGVEAGNVLARMTNAASPMPPSGLLPASTVDIIQQWAAEGYPED